MSKLSCELFFGRNFISVMVHHTNYQKNTPITAFLPPKLVFQGLGFCSPVYAAPRSPRSWIAMTQVLNLNLLVVLRPMQVIKVVNPRIERGTMVLRRPRSWWAFGRWFLKIVDLCQSVMEQTSWKPRLSWRFETQIRVSGISIFVEVLRGPVMNFQWWCIRWEDSTGYGGWHHHF